MSCAADGCVSRLQLLLTLPLHLVATVPKGFQEAGIFFALPMLATSFALVAWGATSLLAAASAAVTTRQTSPSRASSPYVDLLTAAFGPAGGIVGRTVLVTQQCGICLTYFVFIATNASELLRTLYPNLVVPSVAALCGWQLLFHGPLACIRDIKRWARSDLLHVLLQP